MVFACLKNMPEEDALNLLCDELKSFLVAIGIAPSRIPVEEDTPKSMLIKAKSMPEDQAYAYLVKEFKERVSALGVDQSVVRALRFE